MRSTVVAHIAIAGLVSACSTSLQTEQIMEGARAKPGVLYNLPAAQLEVAVKFRVVACREESGFAILTYAIDDAEISHSLGPDALEVYRFDYSSLNAPTKTTKATVQMHPNGMIKSINADIDDRTAQIATAIATTTLNLAKAQVVPFAPTAAGHACHAVISNAIQDLKSLRESTLPSDIKADKDLTSLQATANEAAAKVEALKLKIAAAVANKDAAAEASLKLELISAQASLNTALNALVGKTARAPVTLARIAALTDLLTATARISNWVPHSRNKENEACQTAKASQSDFFRRFLDEQGKEILPKPASNQSFMAEICVKLLPPSGSLTSAENSAPASFDGIVYRLPTLGTVAVRDVETKQIRISSPTPISFPQFGSKGLIWLRNGPFDRNNVKAEFNEDGSLMELTFGAFSSTERAAGAAVDVSKTIVDLMQQRADAAKAKAAASTDEQKLIQQKQLDALDEQLALIKKQKELEVARQPTKDALDREAELLQKQIGLEKLRQELEALKEKAE